MADLANKEYEDYFTQFQPNQGTGEVDPDYTSHFEQFTPTDQQATTTAPVTAQPAADPWRIPAQMGLSAAGAGYNLLGLPGDLEKFITTPPGAVGRPHHQFLPTGPDFTKTTGLSLEEHPELTPTGPLEKTLATGAGALPNALAIAATGGGVLPALSIAESSEFVGQGVKDLAPGVPYLPELASTLTALAGGGVTSWLKASSDAKAAAQQFVKSSTALRAAKSARDIAKDPVTGAPGLASAVIDGSAEKLAATTKLAQAAVDSATENSGKAIEGAAAGFGKSTNFQEAGESVQPLARDWKKTTMQKKLDAVGEPLLKAMPDDTPSPVNNILGTLNSINSEAGRLQPVVDQLIPSLPKQLQKSFQKAFDGSGEPLTTGEVRHFRSAVGDAFSNPKLVNDIGQQNLERIYAAATGDLGTAAQRVGAGDLWNAYNAESSRLYNFAAGPVSKLISTTGKGLEPILPGVGVKGLLTTGATDGTELAAIRGEMPKVADEIAATALREPGVWAKLNTQSKTALVPDAAQRAAIEEAQGAPGVAAARAKQVTDEAAKNHAEMVDAVRLDSKTGSHRRQQAVANAQEVNQLAKANLPSVTTKLSDIITSAKNSLASVVGGVGAHGLAPQILDALGVAPSTTTNALLTGLGIAAPAVYRGAKNVVKSPTKLVVPVTGAVAGQNALSPKT